MATIKVKAKKDLIHSDGSQCFTKGVIYSGRMSNSLEYLKVVNDNGETHQLGNWAKYFTEIKNK